MTKYAVKLVFKYSDVVHVEAENEKEAINKALEECEEQFDCLWDAKVRVED